MNIFLKLCYFTSFILFFLLISYGDRIQAIVEKTIGDNEIYCVRITESKSDHFPIDSSFKFKVLNGDQTDNYIGREISASTNFFGNKWHLENIFPLDGIGSKAYYDLNKKFCLMSKSISQRDFITEGDYVIPFAGIDQNGNFFPEAFLLPMQRVLISQARSCLDG